MSLFWTQMHEEMNPLAVLLALWLTPGYSWKTIMLFWTFSGQPKPRPAPNYSNGICNMKACLTFHWLALCFVTFCTGMHKSLKAFSFFGIIWFFPFPFSPFGLLLDLLLVQEFPRNHPPHGKFKPWNSQGRKKEIFSEFFTEIAKRFRLLSGHPPSRGLLLKFLNLFYIFTVYLMTSITG